MPRKTFTAGEVLAAADVNSFLMDQTVMTFASSAARGSAIPSPSEGMLTYLSDTDSYESWNGSSFVDINRAQLTSSTATSYAVADTDRYKTLMLTSSSNATVTIGTAAAFSTGDRFDVLQDGAGTVTITRDGTAVSLAGRGTAGTAYRIGQRYDAVSVLCVGTNSYRIIGNATAV
jgi:hypothetical protein